MGIGMNQRAMNAWTPSFGPLANNNVGPTGLPPNVNPGPPFAQPPLVGPVQQINPMTPMSIWNNAPVNPHQTPGPVTPGMNTGLIPSISSIINTPNASYTNMMNMSRSELMMESLLFNELTALDSIFAQNPDSGALTGGASMLGEYSNRLFGSPFQLLNSVDRRFQRINTEVGSEFLRNFLLHSPILYIRPGVPRFTGKKGSALMDAIVSSAGEAGPSLMQSINMNLAKRFVFGRGAQLQRRMFGFRETYWEYMQYVNYKCRTLALLLFGEESEEIGTFVGMPDGNLGFKPFIEIRWENYRMITAYVPGPAGQLSNLLGSLFSGDWANSVMPQFHTNQDIDEAAWGAVQDALDNITAEMDRAWEQAAGNMSDASLMANLDEKIKSVNFMVDPVSFNETLTNNIEKSMIESAIDSLNQGIGSEIAFITNSGAPTGPIGNLAEFLGGATAGLAETIANLSQPVTGGFITNLFSGALRSIQGQKMIYPDIYKSSNSSMDYEFSITLTSPYGDTYNYYLNILVPLMHLISLAAPRMVAANSISSPFIVQAYIPGMCTCNMGMISNMSITKNPTTKHVSVHGFPLSIKVTFTIRELYNAMAISPANDPTSFLFNETLNDYLANLAGLIPSVSTFQMKRQAQFTNLQTFFAPSNLWQNMMASPLEWLENRFSVNGLAL